MSEAMEIDAMEGEGEDGQEEVIIMRVTLNVKHLEESRAELARYFEEYIVDNAWEEISWSETVQRFAAGEEEYEHLIMDLQALSLGCKDMVVAMRVEWIHSEYEIMVTEVYSPVNTQRSGMLGMRIDDTRTENWKVLANCQLAGESVE